MVACRHTRPIDSINLQYREGIASKDCMVDRNLTTKLKLFLMRTSKDATD
jgi:hypothetical protein